MSRCVAGAGLWLVLSGAAEAAVEVPNPVELGAPVVVRVVDARGHPRVGATVRAAHRPGLTGASERALGLTDARGELSWTPDTSGVFEIRADDQRARTLVAAGAPPQGTLAGLGLLGALAVGMAVFGLIRPSLPRR